MVRMDSFSSVPPHIQPPMAQVPIAIRELTRFVPSMLMYSSIFAFLTFGSENASLSNPSHVLGAWLLEKRRALQPAKRRLQASELFLLAKRTNVCHQSVNLVLAERTLERGHSALAVRNYLSELGIGQLLDLRRAKIRNLHALSHFGASSVRAVAHRAFALERRLSGGTALSATRLRT